jgi:hypothetical protein
MTGAQIEKAKAKRRGTAPKAYLGDEDHDFFVELLQSLSVDRESVKEAMGFALDNADAYEEVGPSPPAERKHAVPIFIVFVMELVLACCRWLEY